MPQFIIEFKEKNYLTEDELKRFVKMLNEKPCDEDVKRIIRVLLYTGMRSGECFALRWEDVDFEKILDAQIKQLRSINDLPTLKEKQKPNSCLITKIFRFFNVKQDKEVTIQNLYIHHFVLWLM